MNKSISKKLIAVALVMVNIFILASCSKAPETPDESNSKLKITATLFPQYDFARQIVGDKAEVTLLLPPGVESHSFEPTPTDIISIAKSDILLYTGEDMEPWTKKIITSTSRENMDIVDLSENIDLEPLPEDDHEEHEEHEDAHSLYDPHIWTSPGNAMIMVQTIADAVCKEDPDNAEYYKSNAEEYIAKLKELDEDFADTVKNGKRDEAIFGGRFPFHYFASRYNLKYMSAYPSCSSEAEPSVKVIADIITEIEEKDIPVIYYEELVNPTIAKSISEQTGAKMLLFHSCHNVSKEDFEAGVTYLSLMEQNLENLREGLN